MIVLSPMGGVGRIALSLGYEHRVLSHEKIRIWPTRLHWAFFSTHAGC